MKENVHWRKKGKRENKFKGLILFIGASASSFCCVTNHLNTECLKTIMIYINSCVSVSARVGWAPDCWLSSCISCPPRSSRTKIYSSHGKGRNTTHSSSLFSGHIS